MLEMLRRLEEEEGAGDDESDEDDDFGDEKHSLATRLSAINIGSSRNFSWFSYLIDDLQVRHHLLNSGAF